MTIATVVWRTDMDATEVWANARLIAAAPDLLEALSELVDAANERFTGTDPYRAIIIQARAAIAKAKGG